MEEFIEVGFLHPLSVDMKYTMFGSQYFGEGIIGESLGGFKHAPGRGNFFGFSFAFCSRATEVCSIDSLSMSSQNDPTNLHTYSYYCGTFLPGPLLAGAVPTCHTSASHAALMAMALYVRSGGS